MSSKINSAPHCLLSLGKPSLANLQLHLQARTRNRPISKVVQVLLSSSRPQPFHGDASSFTGSNSPLKLEEHVQGMYLDMWPSSSHLLLPRPPSSHLGTVQRGTARTRVTFAPRSLSLCLMGPSGLFSLSVQLGGTKGCQGQAILLTSFSTVSKVPDRMTQMVQNGHEHPLNSGLLLCSLS